VVLTIYIRSSESFSPWSAVRWSVGIVLWWSIAVVLGWGVAVILGWRVAVVLGWRVTVVLGWRVAVILGWSIAVILGWSIAVVLGWRITVVLGCFIRRLVAVARGLVRWLVVVLGRLVVRRLVVVLRGFVVRWWVVAWLLVAVTATLSKEINTVCLGYIILLKTFIITLIYINSLVTLIPSKLYRTKIEKTPFNVYAGLCIQEKKSLYAIGLAFFEQIHL
jgi:hypothetical protein